MRLRSFFFFVLLLHVVAEDDSAPDTVPRKKNLFHLNEEEQPEQKEEQPRMTKKASIEEREFLVACYSTPLLQCIKMGVTLKAEEGSTTVAAGEEKR